MCEEALVSANTSLSLSASVTAEADNSLLSINNSLERAAELLRNGDQTIDDTLQVSGE